MTQDYASYSWRQGAKVHRTLYCQLGEEPDYRDPDLGGDPIIGMMDTAELAREAVEAHNERWAMRERVRVTDHHMAAGDGEGSSGWPAADNAALLGVVQPPEPDPPEDVIRAVRGIHGCSREEALAIIKRDVAAVREAVREAVRRFDY